MRRVAVVTGALAAGTNFLNGGVAPGQHHYREAAFDFIGAGFGGFGALAGAKALGAMADSAEAAQAGRAAYASYRASADLRFAAPGLGVSVQLRLRPAEIALFWLSGILACVIMTALAQLGLIRYRSDQNRRGWTAGLSSRERPLPAGADGLPRRSDFWLATLLAVAAFLILLYAGTRSHHLRHGAASRPTPAAGHQ